MSTKLAPEMLKKVEDLCELITDNTLKQMDAKGFTYHRKEGYLKEFAAHWSVGGKYIRMDVGSSGKYMIELSTGNIYGIKAYGVIHRGYFFGTLDTINEYWWGTYRAIKFNEHFKGY